LRNNSLGYAALIYSDAFNICKLDCSKTKIVQLERELDKLDREDARPLFLINYRRDRNIERARIIEQIEIERAKYGERQLAGANTTDL
jgi:hypothetical protein